MGDPKKKRKKYKTPFSPWQKERIEEERNLVRDYGLRNKRELWKHNSQLKKFKGQVKNLIAQTTLQAKKEQKQLLSKLSKFGLVSESAKTEDILSLELRNILDRRLQTQVHLSGLSKTLNQARQFITHGHIFIDDKKIAVPSYLLLKEDEGKIRFNQNSSLSKEDHPERVQEKQQIIKEKAVKQEDEK